MYAARGRRPAHVGCDRCLASTTERRPKTSPSSRAQASAVALLPCGLCFCVDPIGMQRVSISAHDSVQHIPTPITGPTMPLHAWDALVASITAVIEHQCCHPCSQLQIFQPAGKMQRDQHCRARLRIVFPSGIHTQLGRGSTGKRSSELNTFHAHTAPPGPFILTSFLCTLQHDTSDECRFTTLSADLIPTLTGVDMRLRLKANPTGLLPLVSRPFPARTCIGRFNDFRTSL